MTKKSVLKSSFIIVFAFLLLFSLAFADEEGMSAITDAASFKTALTKSGTYIVDEDFSIDKGTSVILNATNVESSIDFNGHMITINDGGISILATAAKKTASIYNLTFKDSVGNGGITFGGKVANIGIKGSLVFYTVDITVEGGTFIQTSEDTYNDTSFFSMENDNNSINNLTILGGTFVDFAEVVDYNSKLTCHVSNMTIQSSRDNKSAYLCNTVDAKVINWVESGVRINKGANKFFYGNTTTLNQLFAIKGSDVTMTSEGEASMIQKVNLNGVTLPAAGGMIKNTGKLEDSFPGKIEALRWYYIEYEVGEGSTEDDEIVETDVKEMHGLAAVYGEEYYLQVRITLNQGEIWDSSPELIINGKELENITVKRVNDNQCYFTLEYVCDFTDKIVIKSQSPEIVEYLLGETVELFVDAEGATRYQWNRNTNIQKNTLQPIAGQKSNTLKLENLNKTYDGYRYVCEMACDSGIRQSKMITLKLVDVKTPVTEPTPDDPEYVEPEPEPTTEPEETGFVVETINLGTCSDWATEELNKSNEAGLIPTIFDSQDLTTSITRLEFAHVAVKLFEKLTNQKVEPYDYNPFVDTSDEEVLKAYGIGITAGTGEDTFDPDVLITREQMATMMTRTLSYAGVDTYVDLENVAKFADDEEMQDWGKDSIYFMSSVEIIKGIGDNKFGVTGNATREQALLISVRSAEKFGQ